MGRWEGVKSWLENNKRWITYVLIAIIIGAYGYGIALLIGDFLKRELITENGKYEIFRDIIVILLAVTGIVGYAIYSFMSKLIEERIKTYTEELHYRSLATMKMHVGFSYWKDYIKKKHRDKESKLKILKLAISKTKIAHQYSLKLNGKNIDNEFEICRVKNNLAYYLAERNRLGEAEKGDDVFALELIQYVYDRIYKFPKLRNTTLDTYQFVKKQFNSKEPQKIF
jgi:amino acid transporter